MFALHKFSYIVIKTIVCLCVPTSLLRNKQWRSLVTSITTVVPLGRSLIAADLSVLVCTGGFIHRLPQYGHLMFSYYKTHIYSEQLYSNKVLRNCTKYFSVTVFNCKGKVNKQVCKILWVGMVYGGHIDNSLCSSGD